MRLHSLELCGIGPFRNRQSVDFDALTASGLFLIEGPTGSGKTTIIDAIVFALYGSLSGAESDAGRLRSHLCAPDEPTEVSLTFSIDGVRHTITRNPAYERLKARGSGTTSERARQSLTVHDDATPPMREAKEISVYLLQRLGLTVEQFRRLVVLPQGEFDALLRAKPADRYRTLASLIDDRVLERVQDELKRAADEAAQERGDSAARVERALAIARERAAEVLGAAQDPQADPEALVTALQGLSADADARLSQLAAPLEAARTAELAARQRLEAARQATEARAAIARAATALDPDDASLDDAALRARATELVARRTRLEPLADWEARSSERESESTRLRALADQRATALEDSRASAALLPQQQRQVDDQLTEARAIAATTVALDAEVERLQRVGDLLRKRDDLTTALQAAREAERQAEASLQQSRNALHAARTAAADLLRQQLDQRAAHLAALLVDGEACPVCGALDHPQPAAAPDHELITDDDVARADAVARSAATAESTAEASHREAQSRATSIEHELTAVAASVGGDTPDSTDAALASARAAAQAAHVAAESVPALVDRQAALARAQAEAATTLETLAAQAAAARTAADAFDERVRAETDRHRSELADSASASAEIARIDIVARAIDALLLARSETAGLGADIDIDAAARAAAETAQALTSADVAHGTAQQHAVRAQEALVAVMSHRDEWLAATSAAATTAATTAAAIELGALVTARSNANVRKLTLQAYAVQRRFRSVLEAASVHLERMSSGKYAFALDESATGNAQAGLGIDIVDAWNGQTRDPATLSGGETFYASLSLALGLADVVREESGGVTLETLFVDEGFGSLDADTLGVVLDQLDALRARGRSVGVISHVAEMKEWVHDRLEVIPAPSPALGSSLRQTGT